MYLKADQEYIGNADKVILVWNSNYLLLAEQYVRTDPDLAGKRIDLVICDDPRIQKSQLGDRAVICDAWIRPRN